MFKKLHRTILNPKVWIKNPKNNTSIKVKPALFSSFKIATRINSLVVLATVAMLSVSGLSYFQKQENNFYLEQEQKVDSLGEQATKLEKNFLISANMKQKIFVKKDIEYAKDVTDKLEKLINSLKLMKKFPGADAVTVKIDELISHGPSINKIFNTLVREQKKAWLLYQIWTAQTI